MNKNLFINCPFTDEYNLFFNAVVFITIYCGFNPRCALETDDSSENRFDKICDIIEDCRFGFHDISNVKLGENKLPRFNMPLELGLFLAAKKFGPSAQREKSCIIFDKTEHRFRKFISDISGNDIHAHRASLRRLAHELTKWLQKAATDYQIPGGVDALKRFKEFEKQLPDQAKAVKKKLTELDFFTRRELATAWIAKYLNSL